MALISREECLELESMDLSYDEMIDYLELRMSVYSLSRLFCKYGIKHKSKAERIRTKVLNDKGSIAYLARKYNVSISTIKRIRRRFKNDNLERQKNN